MINLIPPVVKTAIVKEYWVRVISVFFFICSFISIASLLVILPTYVLVSNQVDVYASSAAEATERVSEYDLSAGALVKANKMAQKIFELRNTKNFSVIVEQLSALEGDGVEIDSYSFYRKENDLLPVKVTGVSATRQSLSDFRDLLLQQDNISEVVLPISNLTKDKDIEFSISVVLKDTK